MFQQVFVLFCLYVWAVPHWATAITDEQKEKVHQEFQVLGLECMKDHTISEDDMKDLMTHKVPTGDNVPCFLACVMKKAGCMNGSGLLQKETVLEKAMDIFDSKEDLKNIEGHFESCLHVNAESVSDGDKGCERAFLFYKCMMENAAKFGLEI